MKMMRKWRCWVVAVLVAVLVGVSSRVEAQAASPWYGQVALGPAYFSGGQYFTSDGWAGDLLLGRAIRSSAAGALVVAVTAGATVPTAETVICTGRGPCLGTLPDLFQGAILVGLTRGTVHGSASLMAGPGLTMSRDWTRLGLHVQADVTSPSVAHVALVLSPHLVLLPNLGKTSLSVRSFRLGVRVQ